MPVVTQTQKIISLKFLAGNNYSANPYFICIMGEAEDAEAPHGFTMELEKQPVPKSAASEASMDQLSSGNPQSRGLKRRRESQDRDPSHSRRGSDRRKKKKDMGRGEWRYDEMVSGYCIYLQD